MIHFATDDRTSRVVSLPATCRGSFANLLDAAGLVAARLYGRLMLDADVEWRAPFPDGAKIFAGNHPTTTDGFLALALPRPRHVLIAERLFRIPFFGGYLRTAGHIPLRDDHPLAAYVSARRALRAGRSVVLAPEGDTSLLEGGLRRFTSGFAHLAFQTGAPVVPIGVAVERRRIWFIKNTVAGTTEIGRHYLRGRYCVTFGEALRFEGSIGNDLDLERARAQLSSSISALIQQSSERLAKS